MLFEVVSDHCRMFLFSVVFFICSRLFFESFRLLCVFPKVDLVF